MLPTLRIGTRITGTPVDMPGAHVTGTIVEIDYHYIIYTDEGWVYEIPVRSATAAGSPKTNDWVAN